MNIMSLKQIQYQSLIRNNSLSSFIFLFVLFFFYFYSLMSYHLPPPLFLFHKSQLIIISGMMKWSKTRGILVQIHSWKLPLCFLTSSLMSNTISTRVRDTERQRDRVKQKEEKGRLKWGMIESEGKDEGRRKS